MSYYDENAEAFFADTVSADMRTLHDRFLQHVPAGGAVLDAGCGSGRDTLAFIRSGYRVNAFDGSLEMTKLASGHAGIEVRHMTFAEVGWDGVFDGVWASASLLHLPRSDLPDAVRQLARALRRGGVLFASFKQGVGEREYRGRHFTDSTLEGLSDLLRGAGLMVIDEWQSGDVRPGRSDEQWVSAIGRKIA